MDVFILRRIQRVIQPLQQILGLGVHILIALLYCTYIPVDKKGYTLHLSSLVEFVLPIALGSPIETDANDLEAQAVAFIAPSCKFPRFELEGYSL